MEYCSFEFTTAAQFHNIYSFLASNWSEASLWKEKKKGLLRQFI